MTRALEAVRTFHRIIENVEDRCLATDGPVTPTLKEMHEDELAALWRAVQIIRTELGTLTAVKAERDKAQDTLHRIQAMWRQAPLRFTSNHAAGQAMFEEARNAFPEVLA